MSVIYEPSGRALEYSPLACNLFNGCRHACKYCYCPEIQRKSLEDWTRNPVPRDRILEKLEVNARKISGDKREILFSFMSDPYNSPASATYTRQALLICEANRLRVQVLTKAGCFAVNDFDILSRNGWKFGSTIIFSKESSRREWEPGAPSLQSRVDAVKKAKLENIYCWVSLEPVIYPEQALTVIDRMKDLVDFWKIGKINHYPEIERKTDWKKFISDIKNILPPEKYYIKKDLRKYE